MMKILVMKGQKGRCIRIANSYPLVAVQQELDGVSISVTFLDAPPGDQVEQVRKMLLAAYLNNYENSSRLPEGGVQ